MTEIEAEIILAILTKQFSQGFFNILLIDDCLSVSKAIPNREDYKKLTALHAVYYHQMSVTLRGWLFKTCIYMIVGDQVNIGGEWVKKFLS
jgi:hypothetical protein